MLWDPVDDSEDALERVRVARRVLAATSEPADVKERADQGRAMRRLSLALAATGAWGEAHELATSARSIWRALERERAVLLATIDLGALDARLGRRELALSELELALDHELAAPYADVVHILLARVLVDDGRLADARVHLDAAIALREARGNARGLDEVRALDRRLAEIERDHPQEPR